MRILVVGLPKSGTTILTYRIAAARPDVTIEFEPMDGPDAALAQGHADVVTKKLVGSQTSTLADFAHYDRKIWICRDPRDFLVSQSLYRWHRDRPPTEEDQQAFQRAMATLEAKESDPASVPFLDLEPADYTATFDGVADLWCREADTGWFLYHYEAMVDGRYGELDHYLGFAVDPGATVASGLERVVRRKGAGDWRDWFTETDVAHYRTGAMQRYMETFDYDHDDWAIHPDPHIDPEHGSRYASSLFDDHRRSSALTIDPEQPERSPTPTPIPMATRAGRGVLDRLRARARAR